MTAEVWKHLPAEGPVVFVEYTPEDIQSEAYRIYMADLRVASRDAYIQALNCVVDMQAEVIENNETDDLTGLRSGSLLMEDIAGFRSLATRNKQRIAVVYIDANDLKGANSRLGHLGGDEYLKTIALGIHNSTRAEDFAYRANSSGDEFVVLMNVGSDVEGREDGWVKAAIHDHIDSSIAKELEEAGLEGGVGIGICLSSPEISDLELIDRADKAMLANKRSTENEAAQS